MLPCVPAIRGRSWLSSRSRRFRAVRVHLCVPGQLSCNMFLISADWFGEIWLRWTAASMWSLPKSLFDSPTWTVIASTCLDRPKNSAALVEIAWDVAVVHVFFLTQHVGSALQTSTHTQETCAFFNGSYCRFLVDVVCFFALSLDIFCINSLHVGSFIPYHATMPFLRQGGVKSDVLAALGSVAW